MSVTIRTVQAWEALDSRGHPTVAARVGLSDGSEGVAMAPAGASAGSHEAVELRDGEPRYFGRGVRRAVANVIELGQTLVGLAPVDVDEALTAADPSPGFAKLGANAVLAVSIAAARADAAAAGTSLARRLTGDDRPLLLPMPMVNVLSGGAHAGAMLDVQDFLVIPVGATSFAQAIEWAGAVRTAATRLAVRRGFPQAVLVADEGGVGVPLPSNRAALNLLTDAISAAGLAPGVDAAIAVDVAATQFHTDGRYRLACEDRDLCADELIGELVDWCANYPIASLEDVLAEDDWPGWQAATTALGDRVQLIGDDLFVTSTDRLTRGIDTGIANSVLVKVNQNGLLSGAKAVADLARRGGYSTVVSARSGETEDDWLADLAVGWRAGQIKVGSTHRSERTAKWNRLLRLEATENTTFAGPWHGGQIPKEYP
ncbi:phosphopyruvate hydratase [Actinokineospora sp. HUAS TT18]|uniref:phosphopyruvate hydratase n=1 Tax=Actinokineospora sp. HUAS TT18 TaxID=3447451 RepID=UPI003F51DF23